MLWNPYMAVRSSVVKFVSSPPGVCGRKDSAQSLHYGQTRVIIVIIFVTENRDGGGDSDGGVFRSLIIIPSTNATCPEYFSPDMSKTKIRQEKITPVRGRQVLMT